jgi:hypothetical protein
VASKEEMADVFRKSPCHRRQQQTLWGAFVVDL